MKAIRLYRIASVLLGVLAVGHTVGFLKLKPTSPEGLAVWNAMNNVYFQEKGTKVSYEGIYTGLGLYITLCLVFFAFLAWHLGSLASKSPQAIGALGWVFCAVQVVSGDPELDVFFCAAGGGFRASRDLFRMGGVRDGQGIMGPEMRVAGGHGFRRRLQSPAT